MLRKALTLIFVVPLAAVIIAFAVANRHAVTVSFDPFSSDSPASAGTVPLFVLIFILVILGVVVGGVASWLRQGKWRRVARRLEAENRRLVQELSLTRERLVSETQRAAAADAVSRDAAKAVEARRTGAPAIAPPGAA